MDFCQLLHKAQKNDKTCTNGARYYSTKFEPPKKMKKETKELSENIKRFLAKKEAEEQKKREEELRKKEELLALRAQDKKATRRVNVMLKRTKSANQSVLDDAVDKTHTAVTRVGPEQPDEDDYGYVSQEASALYEKMMEKYSQLPEEPKFNMFKKKVSTNLSNTKDRVKAALEKEKEDAMQPHRRKRKSKHEDGQENGDNEDDRDSPERKKHSNGSSKEISSKVKLKPKSAAPPPMSFTEILKIAAQKQHEPIMIEEKPQEEERLYTKKQKRELEREREWKEKRERRHNEMENRPKEKEEDKTKTGSKQVLKAASSSSESRIPEKQLPKSNSSEKSQIKSSKSSNLPSHKPNNDSLKKSSLVETKPSKLMSKYDEARPKNAPSKPVKPVPSNVKPVLPNPTQKSNVLNKNSNFKSKSSSAVLKDGVNRPDIASKKGAVSSVANGKLMGKPKEFPPRDLKPKEFPPRDLKPKQFPPPDVRGIKRKQPMAVSRGRIIDDDEDEYDSELDDFIDDGPEEGDYSNYIKEIFGYDKSRYRDVDDDVDNMETSFAQQMKEEVISTKIGIMEDLEDIKKEEEQKRRKALMKKQMRR